MPSCPLCHSSTSVRRMGFSRGQPRYQCQSCEQLFVDGQTAGPSVRRRQTTLRDVAQALGVATSTVSKALHGYGDLNPQTRQAIVQMAQQLNYQPNLLAQSLKSSATYTVGVIVPSLERPFFAAAVSGIQQVVAAAGYRVMVCQSNESYQTEVSNVQALIASRVDGLLVCHSRETENFDHISPEATGGVPLVHFDRVCNEINSAQVVLDDWSGAYSITEHLIQEGCRRIAILAGPESLLISQQRLKGYRDALKRSHLPVRPEYEVHSDFQAESAVASLRAWLALPEPPDAIFAISYRNAFDIMLALKQQGLRIPQDVAVAGFGNEFLAPLIEPGLTTINLHPHEVGKQAAQLFLDQISQGPQFQPHTFVVPGELIIRQSSLKGQGGFFRLEL